jgi:hypothetical protein
MLPPPSVPIPSGEQPIATRAASPPLLPPGVRLRSYGFFVIPCKPLSVSVIVLKKGRLVAAG